MDDIINLDVDITRKRGLALILTKDRARQSKIELIANLILNGPVFVISGDEWLPAYVLPRMIRNRTTEVKKIMGQLRTTRVSTCFRLLDSLVKIPSQGGPIFVMEFLHTFYDANITAVTRFLRLRDCCRELKRLAFHRPVIVMTRQMAGEDYEKFIPILLPIVNKTFTLKFEPQQIKQPMLF